MTEAKKSSPHRNGSSNTDEETDIILQLPNNLGVRRYRLSDAPSLAHHGNNKNVWNNLRNRMPQPYTEESAISWTKYINDPANCVRSGPWTPSTGSQGPALPRNYTITKHDTAIGAIGIDFNDPNEVYARTAEIGYWLGEEYWHQGIMSIVAPAFVKWGFDTFGILLRLEAGVYDRNKASRRCLEKAGFEFEGVRKCRYVKNGVMGDEIMLGMVRAGSGGGEEA